MTETTGQRLRRLRGDRSLREVEAATGIPASSLCSAEKGTRGLSDKNKSIIANYYGRTVGYIFFSTGTRKMRE
jgi:transcriptional regulator with XRE-family HTH domain